jgi:hypothetical protein
MSASHQSRRSMGRVRPLSWRAGWLIFEAIAEHFVNGGSRADGPAPTVDKMLCNGPEFPITPARVLFSVVRSFSRYR